MKRIIEEVLNFYGEEVQFNQATEEFAELIVAINHLRRGRKGAMKEVIEELADTRLMNEQLAGIVGEAEVEKIYKNKLIRIGSRMDADRTRQWREGKSQSKYSPPVVKVSKAGVK